jgi:hypothetical protein
MDLSMKTVFCDTNTEAREAFNSPEECNIIINNSWYSQELRKAEEIELTQKDYNIDVCVENIINSMRMI